MKFGFSVIADVAEQKDLQLIADALSDLIQARVEVRDIMLSTAYPLEESTDEVTVSPDKG